MAKPVAQVLDMPARPSADIIAALGAHAVSHLADALRRPDSATGELRPRHRAGGLCGPAFTVRLPPGDNLFVQRAVDLAQPGDVIVVDVGGSTDVAVVGDIVSAWAAKRGVAGFVIDGAVRDLADISTHDLPVYARGISPKGPTRVGPGEINVPVVVGGMAVRPGDIIVGDVDGLVVVRPEDVERALAGAGQLRTREGETHAQIAAETLDRSWAETAVAACLAKAAESSDE